MDHSLTITSIQTNLNWEDKAANLHMLEQKINSIKEKTEIVVLPEMFSTGFSMKKEMLAETMEGETVQWMKGISAEKKIILTGSFICRGAESDLTDNNKRFRPPQAARPVITTASSGCNPTDNMVYMINAIASPLPEKMNIIQQEQKRLIASVKGWKINLLVCYDLRFPVWARQSLSLTPNPSPSRKHSGERGATAPEYDVLIYVANWPERRIHAWNTLLQARAIENQCYVVGVNRVGDDGNNIHYSGESMIIDPLGETLYTKKDEEDIFTIALDKNHLQMVREKFPFLRDGDNFKMITDRE